MQQKNFENLMAKIRTCYIAVYIIYVSVIPTVPVRLIADGTLFNSAIYALLAITGVLLVLVDFFRDRTLFTTHNNTLLVLFFISCIVSSILNAKYGIISNLKTLAWTGIHLFLLLSLDVRVSPKTHTVHLQILTEIFDFLWFIFVCWSLGMYITQYHAEVQFKDIVNSTRIGFTEGRLFGVFTDPNYASMLSFAAIIFALINLNLRSCSIIGKIFHGIEILAQACYILLSGSRTTEIAIMIAFCLAAGFLIWILIEKKGHGIAARIVCSLVAAVLTVGAVFGFYKVGRNILQHMTVQQIHSSTHSHEDVSSQDDPDDVSLDRPDVEKSDFSNNRFQIWKDYSKVFASAPLLGTSPRNTMAYTEDHFDELFVIERQYSVHNTYIALFVCTGIIGGGFILTWLVLQVFHVFGYLIRRRKTQDKYYKVVLILTLILIADAVGGMSLYFMFFNNMIIDIVFWMTFGFVLGFIKISEPERTQTTFTTKVFDKIFNKIGKKAIQ